MMEVWPMDGQVQPTVVVLWRFHKNKNTLEFTFISQQLRHRFTVTHTIFTTLRIHHCIHHCHRSGICRGEGCPRYSPVVVDGCGSGGARDGSRLVVLGAQCSLLQCLLVVVRLRSRLDVHEGHGGAQPGALVTLGPRQQFDTLHPPIPVATTHAQYTHIPIPVNYSLTRITHTVQT